MPDLPEPTWSESTIVYDELKEYCKERPFPHVVTGVLIQLIRDHFSLAENIMNHKLRSFVWQPDDPAGESITTHIRIEEASRFNPESVQQRPSVLVSRKNMGVEYLEAFGGGMAMVDPSSGVLRGSEHTVNLQGDHLIEVVGQTPMEAELLGEEVFFKLLEFRPVIQKDLNLSGFRVKVLNEMRKVDENNEHWRVAVGLTWTKVHSWVLTQVSPVLKSLSSLSEI